MKIAAIQSSFIPWRGYFDIIDSVDLFVIYDDVKYSKGGWRNRNQIRISDTKKAWLTVPVLHPNSQSLVSDVKIDFSQNWQNLMVANFTKHYQHMPFFNDAISILNTSLNERVPTLTELNIHLLRNICDYLNIQTPLQTSQEYHLQGRSTDRLIDLFKKTKATRYLSGPSAESYLDLKKLKDNSIRLFYKEYEYPPYPQNYQGFDGQVSILDTIASLGKETKNKLKSLVAEREVM